MYIPEHHTRPVSLVGAIGNSYVAEQILLVTTQWTKMVRFHPRELENESYKVSYQNIPEL